MNIHTITFKTGIIFLLICIFAACCLSESMIKSLGSLKLEKPFSFDFFEAYQPKEPQEVPSPSDHIKKEQIHVYDDKIIINVKDAAWAEFIDTNSMDPLIDVDANTFEIKPKSTEDIHTGDVVSYKSEYTDGIIVHRVVEINKDEDGWYCRVKGDNLSMADPGKIRFSQISGVLIGIIY